MPPLSAPDPDSKSTGGQWFHAGFTRIRAYLGHTPAEGEKGLIREDPSEPHQPLHWRLKHFGLHENGA
jgi:hypothetical protein